MKAATSFNGGLTWDVISEVQQRTTDKDDNDAAHVIQLPNGRVLYVFQNHSKDENTGKWTRYRITVCYSTDYGYSWEHLAHVYQRPAADNGLWEPLLKYLPNGELHCYFSEETSLVDRDIVIHRSYNQGQDWEYLDSVIGLNIGYTIDGSPGVATISDSKLMLVTPFHSDILLNPARASKSDITNVSCSMVFEEKLTSDPNNRFGIYYAISTNNGVSYPTRGELYQPPAGRGAASPQIINVDGILVSIPSVDLDALQSKETLTGSSKVASYISDVDRPNLNSEEGADFFVRTSTDDGSHWSAPTLIGTGAYRPGLLTLDSTTFLALWTSDDLAGSLITQRWKII